MSTLDIRPFPPSPTPVITPAPPAAEISVDERRRWPRLSTTRPAKVFLPSALRYAASETTDISAGGALLRVDRARALAAGDRIDIAVVSPGQVAAVLETKNMIPARVVRVTAIDHYHQAVAIEFESPLPIAA